MDANATRVGPSADQDRRTRDACQRPTICFPGTMTAPIPRLDPDAVAKIAALGRGLVVLDTNVVIEIVSIDLMGKAEGCASPGELRRSPAFRSRQLRAKYSNVLGRHLARSGRPMLGIQDEGVRILTTNVAPRDGGPLEAFTGIIVHHLLDELYRGHLSWLRDDEFSPKGNAADRWLIGIAAEFGAPLVTNEGVTTDGISDRKKNGDKNLRARASEAEVEVYSPSQFLQELGVDVDREAIAFVEAVSDSLRSAVARGVIPGRGAPEAASLLVDAYRFVMLDEVDDEIADIAPPEIPWAI